MCGTEFQRRRAIAGVGSSTGGRNPQTQHATKYNSLPLCCRRVAPNVSQRGQVVMMSSGKVGSKP